MLMTALLVRLVVAVTTSGSRRRFPVNARVTLGKPVIRTTPGFVWGTTRRHDFGDLRRAACWPRWRSRQRVSLII